jgi:hypothetical protein
MEPSGGAGRSELICVFDSCGTAPRLACKTKHTYCSKLWQMQNTCSKAIEKVFRLFGIPETVSSDEGSEFTNEKFIQLSEKHKIELYMLLITPHLLNHFIEL